MRNQLKSRSIRSLSWVLLLSTFTMMIRLDAIASTVQRTDMPVIHREKLVKPRVKAPVNVKPKADVRELTSSEMRGITGRGVQRFTGYCGVMPWQKSFKDVNLANGNLFKSFTDIQAAPARGAGLVMQRTYNSNDCRIGPFGPGWTHAYEIRMRELGDNKVEQTDFFGGKHTYVRDADGLYTPPPYKHNTLESSYQKLVVDGEYTSTPVADTDTGLDGTTKSLSCRTHAQTVYAQVSWTGTAIRLTCTTN